MRSDSRNGVQHCWLRSRIPCPLSDFYLLTRVFLLASPLFRPHCNQPKTRGLQDRLIRHFYYFSLPAHPRDSTFSKTPPPADPPHGLQDRYSTTTSYYAVSLFPVLLFIRKSLPLQAGQTLVVGPASTNNATKRSLEWTHLRPLFSVFPPVDPPIHLRKSVMFTRPEMWTISFFFFSSPPLKQS